MEDDARAHLINFYTDLRKTGESKNTPVPVTARQLEALVRLSEASARVRLSNIVTLEDAETNYQNRHELPEKRRR